MSVLILFFCFLIHAGYPQLRINFIASAYFGALIKKTLSAFRARSGSILPLGKI